jgi:hypothetical protein
MLFTSISIKKYTRFSHRMYLKKIEMTEIVLKRILRNEYIFLVEY